jgi:hypothetical protein
MYPPPLTQQQPPPPPHPQQQQYQQVPPHRPPPIAAPANSANYPQQPAVVPATATQNFHHQPHQPLQQYPQQQNNAHPLNNSYPQQYLPPQQSQQQQQYPPSAQYPPVQHQPQSYQQQQQQNYNGNYANGALAGEFGNLSVSNSGFNKLWGIEYVDLLKQRQILPPNGVQPPDIRHSNEFWKDKGANPE